MSSRPNSLTPSSSNLSHTLTSTHTHYQHISPHRHLPRCIQPGSGYTTAKKTYIKHFSYRKLLICLSSYINSQNTLEQVVFNQVSLFLSQKNKLDVKQSGFRSGHSTETALLSITEALRIAKADSKSSVLILLDLSAAFDTVNHQILLSTLSSLDITGIPLHWFESYLTGQSFRVAWRGEESKAHQLVTGVPQGSVLGPLLFSTYTTSLGFPRDRFLDPSSSPHTLHHWGSPGIGSWTPPLLHIHYITGSHHTGTWLLIPFLR